VDLQAVGRTALFANELRCQAAALGMFDDPYSPRLSTESTRNATVEMAKTLPFMTLWLGARTVYVDERVRMFLESGGQQVVLLGSGLDCRSLRFPAARFFEIDQPEVLAFKKARLELPSTCLDVEDYTALESIPATLKSAGLDLEEPVLYCWEGNIPYLPSAKTKHIFNDILLQHGNRTHVVFDAFSSKIAKEDACVDTGDPALDAALHTILTTTGAPPGQNLYIGPWDVSDSHALRRDDDDLVITTDATTCTAFLRSLFQDKPTELDALLHADLAHPETDQILASLTPEYYFHTVSRLPFGILRR